VPFAPSWAGRLAVMFMQMFMSDLLARVWFGSALGGDPLDGVRLPNCRCEHGVRTVPARHRGGHLSGEFADWHMLG
jgi:hypothetical protein